MSVFGYENDNYENNNAPRPLPEDDVPLPEAEDDTVSPDEDNVLPTAEENSLPSSEDNALPSPEDVPSNLSEPEEEIDLGTIIEKTVSDTVDEWAKGS
jgi:hypothetical protein